MRSATLLEATLSYYDISKGRLAAVEGNPFAVLEVERPKKQHRRSKKSQQLFSRAREQLQDTYGSHQIMANGNRNTYEALYIPSTTFVDLPGELRNAIYDYSITHCQNGQKCSAVEGDSGNYCAGTLFLKGCGRLSTINEREPHMALLFVNKQVSTEWRSILDRHVAVQMHRHVTLEKTDDSSMLLLGDLEKAFPLVEVKDVSDPVDSSRDDTKQVICTTNSRGIYLDLFCYVTGLAPAAGGYIESYADIQTTEEELNFDIITAAGFEDFANRLRLCDKLEDLIIEWRMQADWAYVPHPEPSSETPNMLFESMIQIIETIPNLRRYCLTIGGYAMFASRSKGQSWDGETTLRLSHETGEGYFDGPCAQLYRDLMR